jgi:uncharacterized damage-inducible protein DinB
MTPSALQSELRDSRANLFTSIHGLTEEQFRFAPAADAWSIATHLAHLLRIERLFQERASRALAEDEPHMASTRVANDDDPSLAQHLAVPQIIHGMQAARRELDALLERCDDAALERAIVHERIGRMTIEQIAMKMVQHEREHTTEIEVVARLAPDVAAAIPLAPRS